MLHAVYRFQSKKLLSLNNLSPNWEKRKVKKVPLFEHEIPRYRKRKFNWTVKKQTR